MSGTRRPGISARSDGDPCRRGRLYIFTNAEKEQTYGNENQGLRQSDLGTGGGEPEEWPGQQFRRGFNRLKPYINHNDQSAESGEINSGICFELLQFLGHSREPVPVPPEMEEIRKFLEESCTEPLQMTGVAKRFRLSLPTLNRRFQQCFGTSPYHFRLELRIRKAEELLTQTAMPVKEIAFLLGYAKPLYFSAEFMRFRGISPREFRNRETAGPQPLPG